MAMRALLVMAACVRAEGDWADETKVAKMEAPAMSEAAFLQKWAGVVERVHVGDEALDDAVMVEAATRRALEGDNPFSLLLQALQQISSTWSSIVNAFKSSYSKEIADKEFANGWSKFKAATKVFKGAGLAGSKTDEFFRDIQGLIQLPSKYEKDFQQQIEWIKLFDNFTWSEHNTQFAQGKGGTDTMFSMFAKNRHDAQETMDVLFMTCAQEFKLADNYFVISESKSILGGIFSKTDLKFKKIPAGITSEELMFVSEYFSLLAYQQLALAEGTKVPPDPSFPSSATAA
jgi:hypothetical protein